jgi:ABC-type transporter Mla MlaB component
MPIALRDSAGTWIERLCGDGDINDPSIIHEAAAREASEGGSRAVRVDLRKIDRPDTWATQILLDLQRQLAASELVGNPC